MALKWGKREMSYQSLGHAVYSLAFDVACDVAQHRVTTIVK